MAKRIQIGEGRKGSFGQNEDWWHFVVADDGNHYVEHEWSYVDPYGKKPSSSGLEQIPVDDFLARDYSDGMKSAVREAAEKNR